MGLIPLVGANEHPCHLEKIFHIPGMVWSTFPILSHNPFWFFFNPYLIIPARQILLSSLLKKTRLKLLRPLIQDCSESLVQSEFKFKSIWVQRISGRWLPGIFHNFNWNFEMKPCLDFSVSLFGVWEEYFCEHFSLWSVADVTVTRPSRNVLLLMMKLLGARDTAQHHH